MGKPLVRSGTEYLAPESDITSTGLGPGRWHRSSSSAAGMELWERSLFRNFENYRLRVKVLCS
jgi:hypothetical protein